MDGPGADRHIVFLASDHEYRTEETCPALARILARHHGFKCTVLFSINPETGEIEVGEQARVSGCGLGHGYFAGAGGLAAEFGSC